MSETFDAALDALQREQFYVEMAAAESALRADPHPWEAYVSERDAWLGSA